MAIKEDPPDAKLDPKKVTLDPTIIATLQDAYYNNGLHPQITACTPCIHVLLDSQQHSPKDATSQPSLTNIPMQLEPKTIHQWGRKSINN
jgi:hypothetical protein